MATVVISPAQEPEPAAVSVSQTQAVVDDGRSAGDKIAAILWVGFFVLLWMLALGEVVTGWWGR